MLGSQHLPPIFTNSTRMATGPDLISPLHKKSTAIVAEPGISSWAKKKEEKREAQGKKKKFHHPNNGGSLDEPRNTR
ncbi:hypothetical protein ACS0TY_021612 [Phlomoides rotata]